MNTVEDRKAWRQKRHAEMKRRKAFKSVDDLLARYFHQWRLRFVADNERFVANIFDANGMPPDQTQQALPPKEGWNVILVDASNQSESLT